MPSSCQNEEKDTAYKLNRKHKEVGDEKYCNVAKAESKRQRQEEKGLNDGSWKLHFYQATFPSIQSTLDDPLQGMERN